MTWLAVDCGWTGAQCFAHIYKQNIACFDKMAFVWRKNRIIKTKLQIAFTIRRFMLCVFFFFLVSECFQITNNHCPRVHRFLWLSATNSICPSVLNTQIRSDLTQNRTISDSIKIEQLKAEEIICMTSGAYFNFSHCTILFLGYSIFSCIFLLGENIPCPLWYWLFSMRIQPTQPRKIYLVWADFFLSWHRPSAKPAVQNFDWRPMFLSHIAFVFEHVASVYSSIRGDLVFFLLAASCHRRVSCALLLYLVVMWERARWRSDLLSLLLLGNFDIFQYTRTYEYLLPFFRHFLIFFPSVFRELTTPHIQTYVISSPVLSLIFCCEFNEESC